MSLHCSLSNKTDKVEERVSIPSIGSGFFSLKTHPEQFLSAVHRDSSPGCSANAA